MSAMLDVDADHLYSRWAYATSDARSEPIPPFRPQPRIVPASHNPARPPPPPTPTPPTLAYYTKGVWTEDGNFLWDEEHPLVQSYLDEVRSHKSFVPATDEKILALAALSVLQHPEDIAHWILWNADSYYHIGAVVDKIALARPRQILTSVPWNGAREYKLIVNARQYKFDCIVVRRKWYSTDCTGTETNKRNLRSSGEQSELTVNEYFGIVENEGSSRRKAPKYLIRPASSQSSSKSSSPPPPPAKRTRRPAAPAGPSPAHPSSKLASPTDAAPASSQPVNRTSTRIRRKVTPSSRSPRIVSATAAAPTSPEEPIAAPIPVPAVAQTHSRNRSSSAQSSSSSSAESSETVVERSPSVSSVETAVPLVSPRKRKIIEVEEDEDDIVKALVADEAEGMQTRHRASRTRGSASAESSRAPSRVGTPTAEPRPKASARARPRTKRARV